MRQSKDGRYWTLVSTQRTLTSHMAIHGKLRKVKLKLEMWCEVPVSEVREANLREAVERKDMRLL